jgi:3-hydroxyisobutyrate dehydrogenase
MARLGESHGFSFVDGPVSGGPAAANAGTMTMLLGGATGAIEKLHSVLDILTAKTVIVGGSGAGHAAKIANNMLCAANLVLVAEALRLGQASGVAAADLLEAINAGSGRSGVSEVNFPKWVLNGAFDSGFTMGLMRKDVGLAIDLAKSSGVELAAFAAIAEIWRSGSEHIPDSADFNEIVKNNKKGRSNV